MILFSKIQYFAVIVVIVSEVFAESKDNKGISSYGKNGKTHDKPNPRPTPPPENELEPEVVHPAHPEWTWKPVYTTKPRPGSGWHPEPEWPHHTHRPEPERTTTTTTTTSTTTTTRRPRPEPEPEWPEPEPEWPGSEPEWPEPESEHPIKTSPRPGPECRNIRCPGKGYRCDCLNPCPATCKNPNRKPCPTYECKPGCVCDKGYVLGKNGTCIPLGECPPNGPVCDHLCTGGKQCVCENPCPATCSDPDPIPCPTLVCNPGCYTVCKKGFVLDRIGGDCIPLQYCPNRQCIAQPCNERENEVYYECSTRFCNRTCDNPHIGCTEQCLKPGNYDCRPGYLRDLRTGRCVLPTQCHQPIRCDRKDEVFYECETRMCQRTCQRPNPVCPAVCYQPGNCDCRPGLVRDVKTCRCVDQNESSCLSQRIPEN